jgi:CubicO group peptidase (beta-lactamase class C family)
MRRVLLSLIAAAVPLAAQATMESIFAPLDGKNPGASVLVIKNGRTFFERGYGVRDLKSNSKITSATNFRLASVTKQFTAMAVMLLVKDRQLRYEDRLTDFFPDFPEWGRAVTVRHLLTHTAGLPDYEDLMSGGKWTATHQITDQEALDLIKRQKQPKFAPGAKWAYSNSAYVVLGLIVAKAGKEPYPDVLKRWIFEPLHMKHTLAFVSGPDHPPVPSRALGYSKKGGQFVDTDQSSTSATLGDGGIYSNTADLAKWDEALRKYTLLPKTDFAAALTPILVNGALPTWPTEPGDDNLAPGKPVSYGFGWFLDPYKGRPRMWHTGTTSGFHNVIERFPDEELTIIILANRTDVDVAKLAIQVADLMDAREVMPRK